MKIYLDNNLGVEKVEQEELTQDTYGYNILKVYIPNAVLTPYDTFTCYYGALLQNGRKVGWFAMEARTNSDADYEENYTLYKATLEQCVVSVEGKVYIGCQVLLGNSGNATLIKKNTAVVQFNVRKSVAINNDILVLDPDQTNTDVLESYKNLLENALLTYATKATTYTKTEVDGKLDLKADKSNTYTKTEVDKKVANLATDITNLKNQVVYFYPQAVVYITETTNDKILFGYTSYMSMRGFSPNVYSKSLTGLATDINKTIVLDGKNRNCIELNTGEILVYDSVAKTYAIKETNNVLSTDYVILKCNQGVIYYACIGLLTKYIHNELYTNVNNLSSNILNIKKNVYFSEGFKVIEKYTYNNSSDYIAFSFSSIRNRGFNNTHYNDSFNTIIGYLCVTPEVIDGVSYILLDSNEVFTFNDATNTYSIKARNNININDYIIIGCNQGQISQCPIDMINQYLKNYCDKKVIDLTPNLELPTNWKNKINDIKSIQAKKFTMFLQTDTHLSLVNNSNTSDKYEYPMKVLSNYIYNDVNVNLGDIARGYIANEPVSVVENELTEVIQRYLKCSNTPLLLARGNHDNAILSTDGPISDDNLYAYLTKAIKKTTNIIEGGNFYYYKDFDNIRIVVLDTEDAEIKGINNHAISTTQLNWFNNVALNTDKSLIIMSHCPLQQSLYEDTNYCVNMDEIVSSLENYSGDVIACLSGHTHQQADTTVNGINYIGFKNGGDYCNVLLVDLQNKTIDIKLIGDYGTLVDRTFNY